MASIVEDRLAKMGLSLPKPWTPRGNFLPYRRDGATVFLSGQICEWDGSVILEGPMGAATGADAVHDAARICAPRLAYFPGSISTTPEGMGIAMFDEAFEKIDIAHSQKIVHYFATTGLQMLVAAPEPQRPMLMETMNTIVNVSRIPDTTDVFIDVERIGPQALDELRAANPEYLGYDGMKKKMGEEGTVLAEGKAAE